MDGNILVIDASANERDKISQILSRIGNFMVIWPQTLNDPLSITPSDTVFSLIIMDLSLPAQKDGLNLLFHLRNNQSTFRAPIIVTSKADTPELKREVLKMEVNDFIVKPYPLQRLENSIRSLIKIEKKFLYETNEIESINMSFDHYFTRELKLSERLNHPLSILLITLMRIRLDDNGDVSSQAKVSDEPIREIAAKVSSLLRLTDTVVVNKGQDILLILPGTNTIGVKTVCSRIMDGIQQELKYADEQYGMSFYPVHVTFPQDGKDFQSLMECAFKKVSDKEMLDRITAIPSDARAYARRRYNQFRKWWW